MSYHMQSGYAEVITKMTAFRKSLLDNKSTQQVTTASLEIGIVVY